MRGIRRILRLRSVERDIDEELAFHFERRIEALVAGGMSRSDAEEETRRLFGDLGRYREELQRIDRSTATRHNWASRWDAARHTLAEAARNLRRSPRLVVSVVAVLAVGLAATATMWEMLDRIALPPANQVADPRRAHRIFVHHLDGHGGERQIDILSYPEYVTLTDVSGFTEIAAYSQPVLHTGRGPAAAPINAVLITGNYWDLLHARPAAGRFFTAAESAAAERVAVLSHAYWQRRYGGAKDVIGGTLELPDGPYTITGVAPRGMADLDLRPTDVFLPVHAQAGAAVGSSWADRRDLLFLRVIARRAAATSRQDAAHEATEKYRSADAAGSHSEARISLQPLRPAAGTAGDISVAIRLSGLALMLLVVVCANVANLLSALSIRRWRETAVRLALGGSRRRLSAQRALEGMLLALAGMAAAFPLHWYAGGWLRNALMPTLAWHQIGLSHRVLLSMAALALTVGAATALLAAVHTPDGAAMGRLQGGTRAAAVHVWRRRGMMTALQAAVAAILLTGAVLTLRSIQNVNRVDLGVRVDGLHVIRPQFETGMSAADAQHFFREAVDRIARIPGIAGAAAAGMVPFANVVQAPIQVPGIDEWTVPAGHGPFLNVVTPGYFETVEMHLLAGRHLTPADTAGGQRVVIVSESLATTLWPFDQPLGRCVKIGRGIDAPCSTVVGVMRDQSAGVGSLAGAYHVFVPLAQSSPATGGANALIVRLAEGAGELDKLIRAELHAVDSRLRFASMGPMSDLLDPQTRVWRAGATMFTSFGGIALFLAMLGLFSAVAFEAAQRTRELAIRSALGGRTLQLTKLVAGRVVILATGGTALGLAIAYAAAGSFDQLLFQVGGRDLTAYAAVGATQVVLVTCAAILSALRVIRIDPAAALSGE
jgi:putative ABC transport system permease protein